MARDRRCRRSEASTHQPAGPARRGRDQPRAGAAVFLMRIRLRPRSLNGGQKMSQGLVSVDGEGVAAPMGHYSNAIKAGNTLFISGLLPTDASGALVGTGDVGAQSRCVF